MIINQHGQQVSPFKPLGVCSQCGAAAWATTASDGLLCPSHYNALMDYLEAQQETEYKQLDAFEIVDALEDVGFVATPLFPYVIVSLKNRSITPMEVAEALDIDPALVTRSVDGSIRILCD